VGITFSSLVDGKVLISEIKRDGLVAATSLKVGMEVVSINHIVCSGRPIDIISGIIDDAEGAISILAQEYSSAQLDIPNPAQATVVVPLSAHAKSMPFVPTPQSNEEEINAPAAYIPQAQSVPFVPTPQTNEANIHSSASKGSAPPSTELGAKQSPRPPPGCKEGGLWGTHIYSGSTTKMISCLACLFFCLPGLLVLLCPQDKKDAYLVDNKVYDAAGTYLGTSGNTTFIAESDH